MFVLNGIVYGGKPRERISVSDVRIMPDRIMLITFSNGETRLFDATDLKGEVFEPLRDEYVFSHALVDHGVVTWNNGEIDCSPEFMYEHSYEYPMLASSL